MSLYTSNSNDEQCATPYYSLYLCQSAVVDVLSLEESGEKVVGTLLLLFENLILF